MGDSASSRILDMHKFMSHPVDRPPNTSTRPSTQPGGNCSSIQIGSFIVCSGGGRREGEGERERERERRNENVTVTAAVTAVSVAATAMCSCFCCKSGVAVFV